MNHALIETAYRHPVQTDDPVFSVQVETDKMLLGLLDQIPEHLKNLSRRCKPLRDDIVGHIFPDDLSAEDWSHYPHP